MFKTPEQFAAANKASVDALLSLANTALASAERIAALNLNTARTMLEDGMSNTKAVLGAKDPQEAVSAAVSQTPPCRRNRSSCSNRRPVRDFRTIEGRDRQGSEAQYSEYQKQVTSSCSSRPPRTHQPVPMSPFGRQVGARRGGFGLRQHEERGQASR